MTYKYSAFMQQIEYILCYIPSSMLSDRTTIANKVMGYVCERRLNASAMDFIRRNPNPIMRNIRKAYPGYLN